MVGRRSPRVRLGARLIAVAVAGVQRADAVDEWPGFRAGSVWFGLILLLVCVGCGLIRAGAG